MKSKFGKQRQDYPGTRFTIRAQQPWPGFVFIITSLLCLYIFDVFSQIFSFHKDISQIRLVPNLKVSFNLITSLKVYLQKQSYFEVLRVRTSLYEI